MAPTMILVAKLISSTVFAKAHQLRKSFLKVLMS